LHELVPDTATIGFLENPNNPVFELTTIEPCRDCGGMALGAEQHDTPTPNFTRLVSA
jgi:hypothetical protein